MNRCPSCGDVLRFTGIHGFEDRSEQGQPFWPPRWRKWERWSRSPSCGLFVVSDANGTTTNVTREEPKKGYFIGERT